MSDAGALRARLHVVKEKRPLGLTLIAIGKLFKVITLVITGVIVLVMMHDPPKVLGSLADAMRIDPGNRHLHKIIAAASGASTTKLEAISLGTFAYAALFSVEGTGLWLQKHWAEWLTIFITGSFIPLEIIEIAKHPNALRIATLVFNVAALVYLLVRVIKRRASRGRGARAHGAEALHA